MPSAATRAIGGLNASEVLVEREGIYQDLLKQLRLQEARRLILTESLDAGEAGFQVGYERPVSVQPRVQAALRSSSHS
jgi:AraC-like DNA-binding protein